MIIVNEILVYTLVAFRKASLFLKGFWSITGLIIPWLCFAVTALSNVHNDVHNNFLLVYFLLQFNDIINELISG